MVSLVVPCIGLHILKYRCIEAWASPPASGWPNSASPIVCLTPGTYGLPVPRHKPDVRVCQQRFNELCTLVRWTLLTTTRFALLIADRTYAEVLGRLTRIILYRNGSGKTPRFNLYPTVEFNFRFIFSAASSLIMPTSKTDGNYETMRKPSAKNWKFPNWINEKQIPVRCTDLNHFTSFSISLFLSENTCLRFDISSVLSNKSFKAFFVRSFVRPLLTVDVTWSIETKEIQIDYGRRRRRRRMCRLHKRFDL